MTDPIYVYDKKPSADSVDREDVQKRVIARLMEHFGDRFKGKTPSDIRFTYMGPSAIGYIVIMTDSELDPRHTGLITGGGSGWFITEGPQVSAMSGTPLVPKALAFTTKEGRDVGILYTYLYSDELRTRFDR